MLLVLVHCCCITPGMTWYKEQTSEYNQMSRSCASEWDMRLQSLYRDRKWGERKATRLIAVPQSARCRSIAFSHSHILRNLNCWTYLLLYVSHKSNLHLVIHWWKAESTLYGIQINFTSCDVITFNLRPLNFLLTHVRKNCSCPLRGSWYSTSWKRVWSLLRNKKTFMHWACTDTVA